MNLHKKSALFIILIPILSITGCGKAFVIKEPQPSSVKYTRRVAMRCPPFCCNSSFGSNASKCQVNFCVCWYLRSNIRHDCARSVLSQPFLNVYNRPNAFKGDLLFFLRTGTYSSHHRSEVRSEQRAAASSIMVVASE